MIVFLFLCILLFFDVKGESEQDLIKKKIKEATLESKALADELENMLGRIEEFRNENKIRDVKQEEVSSEKQLKIALDNLGKVAEEIENVVVAAETDEEKRIVNQMTKILDDVIVKISLDEEQVSDNLQTGNVGDLTDRIVHIEESIETMMVALGEVISRLKGFSPTKNEINLAKDLVEEHTKKSLKRRKNLKRRKPKQYDYDGSGDDEVYEDFSDDIEDKSEEDYYEESSNENDDFPKENANKDEKLEDVEVLSEKKIIVRRKKPNERKSENVAGQSKSIEGKLEEEECRDTKATNSVKVCVPDFTPSEAVTEFHTQKPEEIKHCFDV